MIYKVQHPNMKNLFLDHEAGDVLGVSAQIRSLKLMVEGNFSPVLAYYPYDVKKISSFESLPKVTEDGEHLVGMPERLVEWMKSESKKGSISLKNGRLVTKNPILDELSSSHSLILYKNPFSTVSKEEYVKPSNLFPVHPCMGFISEQATRLFFFNSLFFTMEISDMENSHTYFGQPYGLTINNGNVITPPLFKRGAFFVYKDGSMSVETIATEDMKFFIGETLLTPFKNCEIWRRPNAVRTSPSSGDMDMVVINNRVISWKENGNVKIPDAGFAVRVDRKTFENFKNLEISYPHFNDISFVVQGGPILMKDGIANAGFGIEEFGGKVSFPPTVFPFNWDETPAARIAIGNDDENIWVVAVEGCNRYPYEAGFDSRGFTLKELADEFVRLGARNALNLDGGGSVQARFLGSKALKYADRRGIPYHEFERPVPAAVFI